MRLQIPNSAKDKIFWWGIFGGFAMELVFWYNLRTSLFGWPAYATPFYFIPTLLMIFVGGFLTKLHKIDPDKPLLAFNIGASAPLLIKSLAQGATPLSEAAKAALSQCPDVRMALEPSIRNFLWGI